MGSWRRGNRSSVRHDLASEADDVTRIVFVFFLFYFSLLLLFELFPPPCFALPSRSACLQLPKKPSFSLLRGRCGGREH